MKSIQKFLERLVDKRTRISREVLENIRKHFSDTMFETVIRSNVTLKEAVGFGKSILDYSKKASGFKDYMMLAEEVLYDEGTDHKWFVEDDEAMHLESEFEKRFTYYDPQANSVKIGGNFNNWNPGDEFLMQRDDYGTWTKRIALKPGTYQYRFVVDGEWVEDHNNSKYIDNVFGGKNSVLEVG